MLNIRRLSTWPMILGLPIMVVISIIISLDPLEFCEPQNGQHGSGEPKKEISPNCFCLLVGYLRIIWRMIGHFIHEHDKIIEAVGIAMTAVFTGTLWWSTSKLWNVTHDLWKAGERQFKRDDPFLLPVINSSDLTRKFGMLELYEQSSMVPQITFRLLNAGKHAAIIRFVQYELAHWTNHSGDSYRSTAPKITSDAVIHAGEASKATAFMAQTAIPISRERYESLKTHGDRLVLHGIVSFSNLSGTDYIQEFRHEYDFSMKAFVRGAGEHNHRRKIEREE